MPDIAAARPISGAPVESAWGGQVHDALEGVQSGVATVSFTAGNGHLVVVFPRPYAAPPVVVATVGVFSWLFATAGPTTATQTELHVKEVKDAQTGAGTVAVSWVAVGTPA